MDEPPRTPIPLDYEMPDLTRARRVRQTATWIRVSVWMAGAAVLMIGISWLSQHITYGPRSPSIKIDRGQRDLTIIGLACQAYASDHGGRLPDTIEDLMLGKSQYLPMDLDRYGAAPRARSAEPQASPFRKEYLSFVYLGKGLTTSTPNPKNVIVAYEPASIHGGEGGFFLYLDHRCEFMDAPYAKQWFARPISATQPTTAP